MEPHTLSTLGKWSFSHTFHNNCWLANRASFYAKLLSRDYYQLFHSQQSISLPFSSYTRYLYKLIISFVFTSIAKPSLLSTLVFLVMRFNLLIGIQSVPLVLWGSVKPLDSAVLKALPNAGNEGQMQYLCDTYLANQKYMHTSYQDNLHLTAKRTWVNPN